MGNREPLDPGIREQVEGYLTDLLTDQGYVTGAQVQLVADMIDRSERTVWRYVDRLATKLGLRQVRPSESSGRQTLTGLDALLDGQPFTFADEDVKGAVVAYFGNLAALHRDACALARQLDLAGPLSYVQLTRKFNDEVRLEQRQQIRRGIKGFRASTLYVRWSAKERNEIWQIDATQLDLWIRPKGTSKRIRPWLLLIVDDRSRVILGGALLGHEYTAADAAACVHQALRLREVTLPDGRVIQVGGVPEKVLCDNALQFTGEVLSHVAQQLGFMMWAVAAYAGEKKGKVERAIRVANEDFARKLPGYANRDHKTFTQKDTLHAADADLLNEQQVLDEFGKWVEEYNNSPHPTVPGKTRYEVWADSEAGLQEVDEELLRPATVSLPRSSYTFSRDGFRVQRDKVKYFYSDPVGILEVGTRYRLRHLPGDPDWVDAYSLDGEFLVRCISSEVATLEEKKAVDRRRRDYYQEIASLRSRAVTWRSQAAELAADDEDRPNVLAVARQQAPAGGTDELVRASLPAPVGDPADDQREPDTGEGDDTDDQPAAATAAAGPGLVEQQPEDADGAEEAAQDVDQGDDTDEPAAAVDGEPDPGETDPEEEATPDIAQLAADAIAEALQELEQFEDDAEEEAR